MPRLRVTRKKGEDEAAASVLGAILILATLTGAILYANAFRAPEKGADGERAVAAALETGMDALAAATTRDDGAPATVSLALAPAPATPSLLRGILIDPLVPETTFALEPRGFAMRIRHVTPSGATVYDLGNATDLHELGRFASTTGGKYVTPLSVVVEGGAALRGAQGSAHVAAPPDWSWTTAAGVTTLALSVPELDGPPANVTDSASRAVSLSPAASARVGGTGAAASRIVIEARSQHASAWGAFMNETFAPAQAVVSGGVATITLQAASPTYALRLSYLRWNVDLS